MENKIYITHQLADTLTSLPKQQSEVVAAMIDSLEGDGWKKSRIVAPDKSQGGGLRIFISGGLRLLFRYAPESHLIIVTSVATLDEYPLASGF